MRIITGAARGARLKTLPGEDTRPTAERVKEAMFSAVQFELGDRRVLELFGGCGQLSLEALSRGAESATIVDSSPAACAVIRENAVKTKLAEKCRVICSGWREFVKGMAGRTEYSMLILDPPYKSGAAEDVINSVCAAGLLSDDAVIIAETDADGVPVPPDGWASRAYRYGKTYVSIMRRASQGNADRDTQEKE